MKLTRFLAVCFCLLFFASISFGQSSERSVSELQRVAKTLEQSATALGYEASRSYLPSDEWESKEKRTLIENHAYYTLFGKDSDDSCLSTNGRIGVTILVFKDAELARHQIDEMKKYHLGNMGVNVTKSDETGYFLEDVNGNYAAVIQDTTVIFFEDRSRAQADILRSLCVSLVKAAS